MTDPFDIFLFFSILISCIERTKIVKNSWWIFVFAVEIWKDFLTETSSKVVFIQKMKFSLSTERSSEHCRFSTIFQMFLRLIYPIERIKLTKFDKLFLQVWWITYSTHLNPAQIWLWHPLTPFLLKKREISHKVEIIFVYFIMNNLYILRFIPLIDSTWTMKKCNLFCMQPVSYFIHFPNIRKCGRKQSFRNDTERDRTFRSVGLRMTFALLTCVSESTDATCLTTKKTSHTFFGVVLHPAF